MIPDFGIVLHPWNHHPEPGNLLDRAAGEIGIDHVTVPAVTGAVTQFRMSALRDVPYFHTEGGWHFPPKTELYSTAGLKPRTSKWCGTRDVLGRLRDRIDELNLRLVLRLDLTNVANLVEQSPSMRQRGAWGDWYHWTGPCPLNPQFREFVQATLEDAARYEPAAFEVERLAVESSPWSHAIPDVWLDLGLQELLAICFCPACRQHAAGAGVDPDQAARSVRAQVERLADVGAPGAKIDPEAREDEVLKAYRASRGTAVDEWIGHLASTYSKQRLYRVVTLFPRGTADRNPDSPKPPCPWLVRTPFVGRLDYDEPLRRFVEQFRPHAAVCVPVWNPAPEKLHQPPDLVRFVSEATAGGAGYLDFEGLDQAPSPAVTWVKQAVRYARRG